MEYKYSENGNFEDFASGRVLYGGKGIPNFPVRILNEIYGRATAYLDKKEDLVVYDPCCGGGYSLTVLGFFHSTAIGKLYGSDIDNNMTVHAKKNLALLKRTGLDSRGREIGRLYREYGKESHKEAIESVEKLKARLTVNVESEFFCKDCTKRLPHIAPDLIITDIPYGNLVEWHGEGIPLDEMMKQLAVISGEKTILALSMDKKQKVMSKEWKRLEKKSIGKRRFEIYCLA